ncbi:hypothetical protein GALMADRAFT_246110 [Galerina marginata CBS 339.88]|uniref:HMG box domain-containing protein n=1 Tax=Galerina marginata (strain CBS 339.88) TaxID=685588 RepID=A0A067TAS4_GALM3|nr:hypothetical protein GALMADRAFT_246110 [Galerina marginata CBS 339.88]
MASLENCSSDPDLFEFEQDSTEPRRTAHGRKKPLNHIPRPPNAFILFRSSFIKSRHVSTGVETNHSTLSKIIGLTWQSLPHEERQKWHARAKLAQDEHKRKYPQYSFKPVHNKARGTAAERKKVREVGPKDQKRCAKIAELLVCGKKGQELEEAIQEFDKHHVPEIVTRFETPITANTFSSTTSSNSEANSSWRLPRSRKPSSSSSRSSVISRTPSRSPRLILPAHLQEIQEPSPTIPFERLSFMHDPSPQFDIDTFAFSISQPAPVLPGGNDFTQVVSPTVPSFETNQSQDTSLLCGHPRYASAEEWIRHGSPLSNSTSSMPSTPCQMNIPFPEPYGTFAPEAASDYVPMDGSYCDYSQYTYPPTLEPTYGTKAEAPSSGFASFRHEIASQPMTQQDLDFSSFMDSLSSYSI